MTGNGTHTASRNGSLNCDRMCIAYTMIYFFYCVFNTHCQKN